ncbi:sarcosine oxidase subunit alpha family protein [Jannaschia sp. LMIT008]|uniref:sarcosine oxidase subunit alpha family protein n=1 Tax=Jannaschia maritima TaxID=3032585 RepID=UPI0028119B82|nr:sarcosine oxidase subunit alpha family protein [Jannaschia sp. LMIT008]
MTTRRLERGGRLLNRARPLGMRFDAYYVRAFEGDTLASAILANGHRLLGRSFKYHRPRSVVASGPEEPNALLGVGEGGRFTPNVRATTEPARDRLVCRSQNAWPSLDTDVGIVNDWMAKGLPAGFYYKTFLSPRPFWKHVFEPFIRRAAGLGEAPSEPDADTYETTYAFCDTLVVGGGIAGLAAAKDAADRGDRVILVEQNAHWGGRAPVDGDVVEGQAAEDWVRDALRTLDASENVTCIPSCQAAGVYDHGYVLLNERLDGDGPRERLWRVRAGRVVVATGALERPLSFAGNDVPGVMLASAVRDYVVNWGVSPGERTVIVTNNDDAYRTALTLLNAGLEVRAILDARPKADGALSRRVAERGVDIQMGRGVAKVLGGKTVTGVATCAQSGEGEVLQTIECDAVAMSGGWSPVVHLWSHCGGKLQWDAGRAMFVPDADRPPLGADGTGFVTTTGAASGDLTLAGLAVDVAQHATAPILPVWQMPEGAPHALRAKSFLDFQNDVKVSDVRLAAQEGFESVEHAKRYTTLGMATDQGKLSNINGLAILSDALGQPIPQTGTTTFRPPWTPVTLGALAGEAAGELFQPLRRTPMHERHEQAGAFWEPVGRWRRPYCFPQGKESHADAVAREIAATRNGVGMLDASTLGKLRVSGPDAGRFVDMLYTNMMSNLGVGRCRYGLMCDENGFLIDDGVVARLSDDVWLCHTTTGGAERIHGWMEDWLQTEWFDWQVHVVDLTEQFAQIAVVGPKARTVLERLGGMDVSRDTLPFMRWSAGTLAGIPVRVFRISFSGELSYEIAVPANHGLELWDAIAAAGADLGITPYGTEALHVMRAEKGFVMIGDETDGTIIPQDLGLDWAISKKKDDFLGKRGQQRTHMTDPDRWKLVGLRTLDGSVLPDGAYALDEGRNENGQRKVQGRVTSTYRSPTLGHGIAMGLVRRGPDRMGQVLFFTGSRGKTIDAEIVSPVFYDPDGEKQDA